ncbi:response regulator [Pseudomonas laurylsulfativorans]|uniref:Response regulator n=1 Tax=Pseudomonas laurylsulfativorans TaxID=1943631 RepID=A0A2S3VR03_9PSED|nr:response regulator [Pseudomonas laurylsulfativorans]POF42293.1 response regulator [Pseudomonas laurylsulfativorans]
MSREWGKLSLVLGWAAVVEGDPAIRKLVVGILNEIGVPSVDFDSADDALIYLRSMPDGCPLVIVDQDLRGQLQGAEFIKMVKAKWPATATILTSGCLLDASVVPYSTTYLTKPWSSDDLVMAVVNLLQPDRPLKKH